MESKGSRKAAGKGALSYIKLYLSRQKLGELLVLNGTISPRDLKHALSLQKEKASVPLGTLLLQEKLLTRRGLYRALVQQASLKALTVMCTVFLAFAGFGMKSARADSGQKDVAAQIVLANAGTMTPQNYQPITEYPNVFGAAGKQFDDMSAFTKWQAMFDRFEVSMQTPQANELVNVWRKELMPYQNLDLLEMAKQVNRKMNAKTYIEDINNYGVRDYWANPVEFNKRGGDCEDFAIAKYVALRALGVPEERLRLTIVHDMERDLPHAVLIVFAQGKSYVLDNQMSEVRSTERVKSRYFPIYSINQEAWWLHNNPADMPIVVASR